MIIGISGTLGAGKDTVAQYLTKKGFQHISLSNILRQEAKKRKIRIIYRDVLVKFGNQISLKKGPKYLAKIALGRKKKKNLVLSSVRKPEEIDYLKKHKDFKLFFVDAPINIRLERMKERAREDDERLTLSILKKQEEREMSGIGSQNLKYCRAQADFLIDNSKTLKKLFQQIDIILKETNGQEKTKI